MTPFFLFFWCKFTWIPRNIPNKYEESLYERTSRDKIWFSRRLFSSAKPVCLSLWCHKYSFAMNIELSTTKSISFMIQDLLYNCQGEWVVWHHFAINKTVILTKIKEQCRFSFFFLREKGWINLSNSPNLLLVFTWVKSEWGDIIMIIIWLTPITCVFVCV